MPDWLWFIAFFVAYIVLMRWGAAPSGGANVNGRWRRVSTQQQ
jgi:hypothetical protein